MKLVKLLNEVLSESNIIDDLSKFNTYDEFESYIKTLSDPSKHEILAYIKKYNSDGHCKSGIVLYHGTPSKNAVDIIDNGFKVGKGQRSGFMGSTNLVENNGIFLTDSKKMANFFGNNRAERGDYVLIKVCANIQNILDLSNPLKIDPNLRKVGLALINDYEGSSKSKLAGKDVWWLLDKKEFVAKIIDMGYDSVKFREDSGIMKMTGDLAASTYLVFDPNKLNVIKNINNLQQLFDFLKS